MASTMRKQVEPSEAVKKALAKLVDGAKIVQLREKVKPPEAKRIREAVALLSGKPDSTDSQISKRQNIYLEFLESVHKMGLSMVVLCAVSLGPSAVVSMRDRDRVALPSKIEEIQDTLESAVLQRLARQYSAKGLPSVDGESASLAKASNMVMTESR
ncbi:hypothetical protein I7I51_06852 [Histoplasma capsulatum]|uniref:Uncharacterized protein n=1 Tax=Ajellomyces capsulatus TaxID=5037 RepID=A0A8A1MIU9_AJECA|nr:predicted protein [Histoplasma mississippiense (nom. inval.)]EDN06471.1 predicted protein [Histoplasma mississippiense (nom. inval.)]QSS66001.1 hypothetical protein I7I51_06852 [Histoplasma capsulatum]